MKIVYIHQYFKTPEQAGGTRSYEMAKRLVLMGHEVYMVTSHQEATRNAWISYEVEGIKVYSRYVPYSNAMGFAARVKSFVVFLVAAALKSSRLRGDVVFATSTPLTVAIPGYVAAKRSRCPMVFEVRDLWPEIPVALGVLKNRWLIKAAKKLERFAYANSARIVALSDGMAAGIIQAGIPKNKVAVIPNSADLSLFDPDEASAGRFRTCHPHLPTGPIILYPGTLGKVNGVAYLSDVAAAALTQNPHLSFVVIGDGAERQSIEDISKNNGTWGKNFFMLPPMPKVELVNAFKDSSLIVSTVIDVKALEANSANKFFDALASATPIAVNYGGWQKELILEYKVGLALHRDPKIACSQIVDFLSNPEVVSATGARAREIAVRKFSRDKLAAQLEVTLREAVANR